MIFMYVFKLYENYANMDIDELHLINSDIKKHHDSIKTKIKKDIQFRRSIELIK